ncbi:YceI family protein [Pelagicoccus sp. SDUM812002]|uniref:YceI family protein n=1 Tax=Pelagicoccus sp. SDUM812002 TaxID=3041266 RepID=UPI00281076E7|nr:YceI family protein [Pelagicoccus sp. SDUM812002]MDQ8186763.1 YceI family protein [Pelagicoccus sp. SDUM812002]
MMRLTVRFRFALLGIAVCLSHFGLAENERSLEIDYDRSKIEIRSAAMGLAPVAFEFEEFAAWVSLSPAERKLSDARFRFLYSDLTSGRESRDQRTWKWLEVDRFPDGGFELVRIESRGDVKVAVGTLLLHGVRREVEFVYSLEEDGAGSALLAEATIDYRDWDLPLLRVFFIPIGPELTITIEARGVLESAPDEEV